MISCAVICGGELDSSEILKQNISAQDYVIAADRGCAYALQAGITPDLAVGDFDSLGDLPPESIPTLPFSSHKDYTDTHIALMEGLERGFTKFKIFAALGGRIDHTFGNFCLLEFLANRGASGKIYFDSGSIQTVKNGSLSLQKREGYVSIFPFGGNAHGITLQGFEYPLDNGSLTTDMPIGVSNHQIDEFATVTVRDGTLLVMQVRELVE